MKYDTFRHSCYDLYTIKTDKFNSFKVEIIFKMKCTKENLTLSALLFDVLMDSNKMYKTNKELTRALELLYDANMYSNITRVGDMLIISCTIDVIDYGKIEKNIIYRAIDLLFMCIFNPNLVNDKFSYKIIQKVKRELVKEIKSAREDAKQTSILNALSLLDEKSPRALSISGSLDVLDCVSQDSLHDFYKNFLEETIKEIYVLGNVDPSAIDQYIHENVKFNSIPNRDFKIYLDEIKTRRMKKVGEAKGDQINYVEIYKLNGLTDYEQDYVITIFNAIWGSGSLESRLYKALRKDKGLCYNVNAYYQKYDRCLIVHTAIDPKNIKEVEKIIKKTLIEMVKTEVSDKELDSSKMLIKNSLLLTCDNATKIIDNALFRNMNLIESIDERRKMFDKVSKSDIKKVAKKIRLVVSYRMDGLK